MKKIFISFIFLMNCCFTFAQNVEEVNKKIRDYFSEFEPQFVKFRGSDYYGQTKDTTFTEYQLKTEIALYNDIKQCGLIDKPTRNVFTLCHNMLIHSPEIGKEFLVLLNKPTRDFDAIDDLFSNFIFAGAFGEQLALNNLQSEDPYWRLIWSRYLRKYAIYDSSIPVIVKEISKNNHPEIKRNLIVALSFIGNPTMASFVKQIIDTTRDDSLQAKAIFVYAEFTGHAGIDAMKKIQPVGDVAKEELKSSIAWFKENAGKKNNYGVSVLNNYDFIEAYENVPANGIVWLKWHGYLKKQTALNPKVLPAEDKKEIFHFLFLSNGFELDMIKGQLFLSLEQSDMEKLLELRTLAYYSANQFSQARMKTLGIMIRDLKRKAAGTY